MSAWLPPLPGLVAAVILAAGLAAFLLARRFVLRRLAAVDSRPAWSAVGDEVEEWLRRVS